MSEHWRFPYVRERAARLVGDTRLEWLQVKGSLDGLAVMRCLVHDGLFNAQHMCRHAVETDMLPATNFQTVRDEVVTISVRSLGGVLVPSKIALLAPSDFSNTDAPSRAHAAHGTLVVAASDSYRDNDFLTIIALRFGGSLVRCGSGDGRWFNVLNDGMDWMAHADDLLREGAGKRITEAALGIMNEMGLDTSDAYRRDNVEHGADLMVAGMPTMVTGRHVSPKVDDEADTWTLENDRP